MAGGCMEDVALSELVSSRSRMGSPPRNLSPQADHPERTGWYTRVHNTATHGRDGMREDRGTDPSGWLAEEEPNVLEGCATQRQHAIPPFLADSAPGCTFLPRPQSFCPPAPALLA